MYMCARMWGLKGHDGRSQVQEPSVPSTSYITLTGHFTPGFRILAERPPQTLWVVPPWWECHSQPAEHHVWTFAHWPWSQICPTGKIMRNYFLFSPFFSLENQKIFQQRGIQCSSFSGLTFSDWQRGRIRFKWKTLFRGAFSPTVFPFSVEKKKKVKSKVRSVLVHFVRMSGGIYLGKHR